MTWSVAQSAFNCSAFTYGTAQFKLGICSYVHNGGIDKEICWSTHEFHTNKFHLYPLICPHKILLICCIAVNCLLQVVSIKWINM